VSQLAAQYRVLVPQHEQFRLAEQYGVADHTVRRALREQGRIETLPHKGSFVVDGPSDDA
jgi:DNA-binding GntR family transcriptional regulator